MRVLVTGAGGFIGSHLVQRLKAEGHYVIGADLKGPDFAESPADEFHLVDLRDPSAAVQVCNRVSFVFNLAADMGGIGFISGNRATISRNNNWINLAMLEAARRAGVERYFFSSSACVYAAHKQATPDVPKLREQDAHPAAPEPGYGWEKLWAEQLCRYYYDEFGLETRIGRYHNVYGPYGTYDGGREKAPAAACRKIATASPGDTVPIWGDGLQTRSFMYIDDCVEGTLRLAQSDYREPLNIGSAELVTIHNLYKLVAAIASKSVQFSFDPGSPEGVRGRCSDNTLIRAVLGWSPTIPLLRGLEPTYRWIEEQCCST